MWSRDHEPTHYAVFSTPLLLPHVQTHISTTACCCGTHTAHERLLMRVIKFHMHTKQEDKLQCCVFEPLYSYNAILYRHKAYIIG